MQVFVLDKRKKPLMPCHPARARELLREGRAVVHKIAPFTIRSGSFDQGRRTGILPEDPARRLRVPERVSDPKENPFRLRHRRSGPGHGSLGEKVRNPCRSRRRPGARHLQHPDGTGSRERRSGPVLPPYPAGRRVRVFRSNTSAERSGAFRSGLNAGVPCAEKDGNERKGNERKIWRPDYRSCNSCRDPRNTGTDRESHAGTLECLPSRRMRLRTDMEPIGGCSGPRSRPWGVGRSGTSLRENPARTGHRQRPLCLPCPNRHSEAS